ncbi:MAG: insulinase family protein, partial [Propionibacteriaceae bacterium]|nr:insulinase family protein [Propionibacteriaceae bacterium]
MLDLAVDYPIHTRTLDNGMRVCVSPDQQVPITAVNLWYDVGSRDEVPGQTGWAHLFEHLMFQGSARVASGEHLDALQAVGGSANATTWFDRTNYFETIPAPALDLALWLEADRLDSLARCLSDESVNTQRDVVKEERRQRYDNVPYGDSVEYLISLAFPPDHPYGHSTIGSMTDLDLATRSSAAAFFTRHYRPDNAVLTICGDVTVAEGFRKAERYFAAIPSLDYPKRPPVEPLPGLRGIPRSVVHGNVPAAAVSFVWRLPVTDTPEYDAATIAMAILGQGLTSRFYRNLVQTELSQGAQAGTLGLVGGNSFGFAQALALPSVSPQRLEEAMIAEVEQLLQQGPDEVEVERVKIQQLRQFLSGLADLGTRADTISGSTLLFDDPAQLNRRLDELAKITCADVRDACADYLDPHARG